MGYSQSKRTLERVRPILDIVIDRTDQLKFPSKTPQKLANVLHNAFKIVNDAPVSSELKKYSVIKTRYKVKVGDGCVIFEPREQLDYSDPITELAMNRSAEMEFPEALTLLEVVGVCAKHKLDKMTFPQATLVEDDFDRLNRWATLNSYLIIDTEPLTLKKNGNSKKNSDAHEN